MRQKPKAEGSAERHVKEIKRQTRRKFSAEEKIRIVLEGLRGEYSIAELCRREGIAQGLYYTWSKDCRYVQFSETPSLFSPMGKKGVFNEQRSARDTTQTSGFGAC